MSVGDADDQAGLSDVLAAIRTLGTCELARCGHRDLDRLAGAAQRVRGFVAAWDTRLARRRTELWRGDSDDPAGDPEPNGGGGGDGDGDDRDGPGGDASGVGESGSSDGGGRGDPGDGGEGGDGGGAGDAGDAGDVGGAGGGTGAGVGGSADGLSDRRPGSESEADRRRAWVGDVMPSFEVALEVGEIDVAHVDAVAAALARFDTGHPDDTAARAEFCGHETELLGSARVERADRFRRRCLDLSRRIARDHGLRVAERQKREASVRNWIDRRSGMGHVHLTLEPELYDATVKALDDQLDALRARDPNSGVPWQRLRVDAFSDLVAGSGALNPRSPEIVVLIDWDTLRSGVFGTGAVAETIDGTPLHPATVRRMACDAGILPVVLGGDGLPLDVGRTRRLATSEQRRALAAMYATCAHPDCRVTFRRCRIHHLDPWQRLGETNLELLVPLCDRHHHAVHEGGWILTMTPERVTTWRTPDGTHWFTGDTRDRAPAGMSSATGSPGAASPGAGSPGGGPAPGGSPAAGSAAAGESSPAGSAAGGSSTAGWWPDDDGGRGTGPPRAASPRPGRSGRPDGSDGADRSDGAGRSGRVGPSDPDRASGAAARRSGGPLHALRRRVGHADRRGDDPADRLVEADPFPEADRAAG